MFIFGDVQQRFFADYDNVRSFPVGSWKNLSANASNFLCKKFWLNINIVVEFNDI